MRFSPCTENRQLNLSMRALRMNRTVAKPGINTGWHVLANRKKMITHLQRPHCTRKNPYSTASRWSRFRTRTRPSCRRSDTKRCLRQSGHDDQLQGLEGPRKLTDRSHQSDQGRGPFVGLPKHTDMILSRSRRMKFWGNREIVYRDLPNDIVIFLVI